MKIISDTTHGVLDYATVLVFALAPIVVGLTGTAALISYALAAIHLLMTILTDMPLGIVKVVPVKLHALVELVVGPVLVLGALALPTLFGGGATFFVIMGVAILLVWLLSNYGPAVQAKA
jgi:hypothetical protein